MSSGVWRQSIVFRLGICLVTGGLLLSIALGVLELKRVHAALRIEITQKAIFTAKNCQRMIRILSAAQDDRDRRGILIPHMDEPWIRGLRLSGENSAAAQIGDWSGLSAQTLNLWTLSSAELADEYPLNLSCLTLLRIKVFSDENSVMLEMLIDGPAAQSRLNLIALETLANQWILLSLLMLLGFVLLRRWFTGPLFEVVDLVCAASSAERFYLLSRKYQGEFSKLAQSIGGMLTRIEATSQRLHQREQAFEDLYQFAPAPMVSLDSTGQIIEANCRAVQLFEVESEKQLIGQTIWSFVHAKDLVRVRQAADRLMIDAIARCDFRLKIRDKILDVFLECTAVRDSEGALKQIRLSLVDVTESRRLQNEISEKTQLLKLVIDHIPDAILVVNSTGIVVAHNQALLALLHREGHVLVGHHYDCEHFWEEMHVMGSDAFLQRLRQIETQTRHPVQERVKTSSGTFLFETYPMHDFDNQPLGRIWVVRDISQQEQLQQTVAQQASQFQALRQFNQKWGRIVQIDSLLEQACDMVQSVMQMDMVGLAVAGVSPSPACRQMLHNGSDSFLLVPHQALLKAIEKDLLPEVLAQRNLLYWPDLSVASSWSQAFAAVGLTSVAVMPLDNGIQSRGILWVACRGGERLESHHLHLLQTLASLIAARLELSGRQNSYTSGLNASPVQTAA